MHIPPASLKRTERSLAFILFACLLVLCGGADADTTYYPETGLLITTDWDGGADLGTYVTLAECSGPYDARHCTPLPHTFTYTLTIPENVNLSRAVKAEIILYGGEFTGDCRSDTFEYNETIRFNDVVVTGCPFNQPLRDEWIIPVAVSALHTGVNTIGYDAYPWKLNSDLWGNTIYGGWTGVSDIRLALEYSTLPPPKLTGLELSPELFLSGHDILVRPVVEGESPDWEITGITYMITDTESGDTDLYHEFLGKHDLVYRPAPGTHGNKELTARMHVRDLMTGRTQFSETSGPMTIYFEKGTYPNWEDDDGDTKPNWIEYWAEDGAVPLLTNTVRYNASGTGYGVSYGNGAIELEPLAATQHYDTPLVIPSTTLSPGGEAFGGPLVTGIDCTAEVMAHENYHNWVDTQWHAAGMFVGQQDSDFLNTPIAFENGTMYLDDRLPDFYEQSVSFTDWPDFTDTYNLKTIKDDVYKFYGDQEYMAMRAGNGARGITENDWAYPGKQAGNRTTISGINPPVFSTCIGTCDIFSPSSPSGSPIGIIESTDDLNGNGLFDHLIANNDITIGRNGMYEISAVLTGDGGDGPVVIDIQRNRTALSPGMYPVPVAFSGKSISSAGIDGPYTVSLTWRHDYRENGEAPSVSWQTGSYTAAQFEPVSAAFAGDASASRYGTDLRALVPLTISQAGTYTVEGYLTDPDGQTVTHALAATAYPAGAGEAALVFDGNAIAALHRDGMYLLTGFRILDAAGTIVGRRPEAGTVAVTAAEYGTLQPILTGSFTDTGSDPSSEGRYGVLSITTGIDAPSAGNYYYSASLYDPGNRLVQTIHGSTIISAPGPQSIPLDFSGKMVYNSRVNGSFTLRALEIYGPGGVDRRSLAYTTGTWEYTEFDQPAIVITGNVTDEAVDYDRNGRYDAVRIGFDVEVGNTGCGTTGCSAPFPLSANLTGPVGTVISRKAGSPSLERYQTHHVTLDFAGTDINGAGFDGPFGVADLTAGFSYPSRYGEPYQTAAYDHTQFEPAAILAGYVMNESGFPVAETRIGAYAKEGFTNAAGYYRLIYGESHTGGVSAMPPAGSGLEGGYEIRTISPGTTTFCNFTLFHTAVLAGTVTAENGTLLATGFVTADGPSDKTFTLATWGNGSYAFTSLKPGDYAVTYIPATGADIVGNTTPLVLAPGEKRSWNITSFNPRALSGTVRDVNGDPVEGAEVSVTDGPVIITWPYAPETDAAGAYTFPRHAPGISTIYVEPPYGSGLRANTSTVTILFSDTTVSHDILMEPEHTSPEVMWPDIDPAEGGSPLTVAFTDLSKGYPTAWFWDFGDGTNSTERNPSHTYTAAGLYTVTLSISNAYGSDSYTFTDCITVTDPRVVLPSGRLEPAASGVFPLSAGDINDAAMLRLDLRYDPSVVRLDGVSSASPLVWTIDAPIDNTTGRAVITILFASDRQSVTDSTRLANLSFTATGSEGSRSALSAASADQVSCGGGEGCWPGAPEILTNLSVTEGSIRVGAADPLLAADFSSDFQTGTAPLTVAFSDTSTGSPTAWIWSFGDGDITDATKQNPSHTYTRPGTYTVALEVYTSDGYDRKQKDAYIRVKGSQTIGASNNGIWNLDTDGSFSWNAGDYYYNLGDPGATPVFGDWNSDGITEVGTFSSGSWFLDYNGNGINDGDGVDKVFGFGSPGYKPVVGDWDGDGTDNIGVELDGFWVIDYNGNYAWDGQPTDRFAGFGQANDNPVVGDWNGDGKAKIGSEKDGFWSIDYNGNYEWEGEVIDRFAGFGQENDNPIVGDWNGDGIAKIGSEKDGFWSVDYNGNYLWDYPLDKFAGFGRNGDKPRVGDYNGDGMSEIASFTDGFWAVDYNGNYVWDGEVLDRFAAFGSPGATPVAGTWS